MLGNSPILRETLQPSDPKRFDTLALSPYVYRGGHEVFTLHAERVNRLGKDAISELSDFGRLRFATGAAKREHNKERQASRQRRKLSDAVRRRDSPMNVAGGDEANTRE